jgi:cobalt transporter subunit CbtB
MNLESIQHGISEEISIQNRIVLATLLGLAGLGLLFLVGFTHGPQNALHNAAHDTRHAFTFPCH